MTFIDQHCTPQRVPAAREGGSDGKIARSAGYVPCDRSIASGDNQRVSLHNLHCDEVSVETNSGARLISLPVYRAIVCFKRQRARLQQLPSPPLKLFASGAKSN